MTTFGFNFHIYIYTYIYPYSKGKSIVRKKHIYLEYLKRMLSLVCFGFGGLKPDPRGRDLLCSAGALQVQHCRSSVKLGVLRTDETMLNWQQDGVPPLSFQKHLLEVLR